MSELNFPKDPAIGQEYMFNTMLYMFDGIKWVTKGTGYNSVQDLYEMLASDAGAAFIGTQHHDSVQVALDELQEQVNTGGNPNYISRFDREALRRTYAEAGIELVTGSFEEGGTINSATQALLFGADSKGYAWEGTLPKVVPPASSPASTGGVTTGAWRIVGDLFLRTELTASSGASLVGFQQSGAGATPRTAEGKLREVECSVKDFGATGLGVVSEVAAFQAALNSGACIVKMPKGRYIIDAPVSIPPGVRLSGEIAGLESQYKDNDLTGDTFKSTVLVMRSTATFNMNDNSAFDSAVLWYDQQNYNINDNPSQPDLLDPFVIYAPAFQYVGNYSSLTIEDVLFLGGTHFFKSSVNNDIEKLRISRIYGFPLIIGIEIGLASDMTWISDIHWNPNSMFQLPGYIPTEPKTSKYTRNTVPFKLGRVDAGFFTNVFVFCCRDFIWAAYDPAHLGGVGGSIRVTNFGADVCHNLLKIDQTQRGFGFALVNGWAVNNVVTIYDPTGGVVNRNPAMVRFGTAGGTSLENAHVEMVAVKRSPGRASDGIPDTGTPQNVFYFDSAQQDLSITCAACEFDDVSSGLIVGSDLDNGPRRYVTLAGCLHRMNQNQEYTQVNAFLASQNSCYSPFMDEATGYVAGPALKGQFIRRARDYSEPNFMGIEALYKDSGGNQQVFSAYRETNNGAAKERLLEVDRISGDVRLSVSAWNQNRLVLGGFYLWVEGSGKLRIKYGPPASDVDGTIVGVQS